MDRIGQVVFIAFLKSDDRQATLGLSIQEGPLTNDIAADALDYVSSRPKPAPLNAGVYSTCQADGVPCGEYLSCRKIELVYFINSNPGAAAPRKAGYAWRTYRCPMHLSTNAHTLGVDKVLTAAGPVPDFPSLRSLACGETDA